MQDKIFIQQLEVELSQVQGKEISLSEIDVAQEVVKGVK